VSGRGGHAVGVADGGHACAHTHARVPIISDSTPTSTSKSSSTAGAGAGTDGADGDGARLGRLARSVAIAPIVLYQRVISPAIPRRCKYEPTCSRYAVEAIRTFGVARGLVLAAWRLLRCNPFSYGGYDPVEAQRVFGAGRPSEGL